MVSIEDITKAMDEQLLALQEARDAVRGNRLGLVTNEERKRAMAKVEEADAKLRTLRYEMIRQAAEVLGATIEP